MHKEGWTQQEKKTERKKRRKNRIFVLNLCEQFSYMFFSALIQKLFYEYKTNTKMKSSHEGNVACPARANRPQGGGRTKVLV